MKQFMATRCREQVVIVSPGLHSPCIQHSLRLREHCRRAGGGVRKYVLLCVLTAEPTRLQQIVPNPWSHRQPQSISVGHDTKGTVINMREEGSE